MIVASIEVSSGRGSRNSRSKRRRRKTHGTTTITRLGPGLWACGGPAGSRPAWKQPAGTGLRGGNVPLRTEEKSRFDSRVAFENQSEATGNYYTIVVPAKGETRTTIDATALKWSGINEYLCAP